MIVKMKVSKKIVLLDIKTSYNPSMSWPVQLAAYARLCAVNGYEFDSVMNVHLKKTHAAIYKEIEGEKTLISPPQVRTNIIEHKDIEFYWEVFSSALKCYDYFYRKEDSDART